MTKKDDTVSELPNKWMKIVNKMPEFKDIADAASSDDLKKIIVTCEGNIYTTEQEMSKDAKLNNAKDLVKEYSASHKEAIKYQTAKIKYALHLLESKGVDLDNKD